MNWHAHASHELEIAEVKQMQLDHNAAKFWGWHEGMFIAGNDDLIALRLYTGHTYENVTRALWKKLCAGAELVADIGTHSGIFTLDAYRAGALRVFSAEPHPINYSRLVMNLRYNGFDAGGAFFGAIGSENQIDFLLVKQMYLCHAAGRVGLHNENGTEFPVKVVRMDSILPKRIWAKLKAVKIDAENYTPNVLDGMAGIFSEGNRPDMILECTYNGMTDKLKSLGYRFWRIWETGKIEEVEDLTPYNPNDNYNGTHEDCRNRFASVKELPKE